MEKSNIPFFILVGVMVLIKLIDIIFNPVKIFPGRTAVFSWIELLLVLVLGLIAISIETNLPEFWNKEIKKALYLPIWLGIAAGGIFIIYDYIVKIGDMSVGLPIAILFYLWGAISTEIIMHLLPISLVVWIGLRFFKKKLDIVYWLGAVVIGLVGTFSMIMAFSNPDIPLVNPGLILVGVLGFLVFITELTSFWLIKKYGILSSILFRLSFYAVWYILWPYVFY